MEKYNLQPRASGGGLVSPIEGGWRLEIPSGHGMAYRFAQLDDYAHLKRSRFPSHPVRTVSLLARASAESCGTWGFGWWNDPFGLSLGFGGRPFRLPALPNAAWFFHASRENWLSFGDKPGNGFLAQTFRAPKIPSAGLALGGLISSPLLATRPTRIFLRKMASRFIREDGVRLGVDSAHWHRYRLEWAKKRVLFEVDNVRVFESPLSPRPPLGVVIWIDNQYAAFTPQGKIGFGVLANSEPAILEVRELKIGD